MFSTHCSFNNLIRFFAHLCLFLQMIDMPVPADATQTILEVYLQVLEVRHHSYLFFPPQPLIFLYLLQEAGQREHIALYASALGENAVERYALFLTSLDLNTDTEERRAALLRAEKHELDMVRVAQVTAEKSLDKAFEVRNSLLSLTRLSMAHSSMMIIGTSKDACSTPSCCRTRNTTFRHGAFPHSFYRVDHLRGSNLPRCIRASQCYLPIFPRFVLSKSAP